MANEAFVVSMTQLELQLLVLVGLLEEVARTADGKVTEYRITHTGRTLIGPKANELSAGKTLKVEILQ